MSGEWADQRSAPRPPLRVICDGEDFDQMPRYEAFCRAHPETTFNPVMGKTVAWVPADDGDPSGVQFSGDSLREVLDAAEAFFRELDSG